MIKKLNDFLAGWPMTLVGGIFLFASFVLPRVGYPEGEYLAWVCVVICGIPLLYLAIWRIICDVPTDDFVGRGFARLDSLAGSTHTLFPLSRGSLL